jgi:ribosome biogenesis GTPase / thiamine phosphate phosphatase
MTKHKSDVAANMQAERVARSIQKASKRIKRNRKPSGPRRRDWLGDFQRLDELDLPEAERVMPRGERERRQAVLSMALESLGEKGNMDGEPAPDQAAGRQGIVVEVSSSLCRVDLDGRSVVCGLRGSLSSHDTGFTNVVAVGDRVIASEDGSGRGVVEKVLPRVSALTRPDVLYGHLQQVIVANADRLLIVAALREPPIWLELIDRYLIAAERHHLAPIICINKIDLAQDVQACRAEMQPYLDLEYRVIWTSALTGKGVRELHEALQGRTTVLAGVSGVGKSSLLAAVQPGLQLRTRTVSGHSHEGRHTTSQVTMLRLEADTFVVDTPGIREFGLSGLERRELAQFYPEIMAAASGCRFGDCSHTQEPGCAVVQAVEQRRISAARYHSFQKIYLSLSD